MATAAFLVLALLAAASAAPESRVSERIVGGTPVTIEEFPYIVALIYTYPGPGITVQRCVASLISSWHMLTSAFCFTGAINENMKARAGSTNSLSGGTLFSLGDVFKHYDYAEIPRRGDIAVVFLQEPLGLSSTIGVLFLPPQGTFIPDGHQVKIVSWGFEYIGGPQLELLKTIFMNKLSIAQCVAEYADNDKAEISERVICVNAEDRGMCNGDSGAPMVIDNVAVGISSFFDECGSPTYPDVFTRIDQYTNWILSVATSRSNSKDGNADIRPVPVVL